MAAGAPDDALDAFDLRILTALARDGRRTAASVAKGLGLSRQAVAARIQQLESDGFIRGYHADVDPRGLGLAVKAHIRLTLDSTSRRSREREVTALLLANPLVRTVERVSGEDCLVVQVVGRSIDDVNRLLAALRDTRAVQSSRTSIVLETLLERRPFGALPRVPSAGSRS